MVSEYKTWKEVNDWALSLFPFNQQLSPQLQEKIQDIETRFTTSEERTVAALRFVQDEIRYMGIEMGENSHKPNHPNNIMAQRFGDCKDKSYLLCTMLRTMGLEAFPVLINTSYKKSLTTFLPSASAFDHTTVQVKIGNASYWFDPTLSYQRGSIKKNSFPDYQCGLIVAEQTVALTTIPLQSTGLVQAKETFRVLTKSGPVQLVATTQYTGSYADVMRLNFNSSSLYEMKKGFEDFYKAYYANVIIDSLSYSDDEVSGTFRTYEGYTIQNFWTQEKGILKSSFAPYMINSVLKKPADLKRRMPFAVAYPARYKENIEIELPDNWNAEEYKGQIKNDNFLLNAKFTYSNRKVSLHYEYESLKDHVLFEESAIFYDGFKRSNEKLVYEITWDDREFTGNVMTASSDTESNTFTTLYLILGLCVFITIMIRRKNR